MCPPTYFTVKYKINPWMEPSATVDQARALAQWQNLHDAYIDLGFTVHLIEPLPEYPDMVYAANGATVINGVAYSAKFKFEERKGEAAAYLDRLTALGFTPVEAQFTNEGEGDMLPVGDVVLAGHGFRTTLDAHKELREVTGAEVVSLELINPKYYHIDTALTAISDDLIAYHPEAFAPDSRRKLRELFPGAIEVGESDARVLGLNAVSDGYNVIIAPQATGFEAQLKAVGLNPIGVDTSELLKGGGGIKCCTLVLRGG